LLSHNSRAVIHKFSFLYSKVSGIEGTFKITCQNTMRVLRDNKESIIAVLEAFVHDPLINWRLVQGGRQVESGARGGEGSGGGQQGGAGRRPRADESNMFDGSFD
jgi:FKBP12-rapamycin complex-associated protein